jgi:hypothetical protein
LDVQSFFFVKPSGGSTSKDPKQDQYRGNPGEKVTCFNAKSTLTAEPTECAGQSSTPSSLQQNDGDDEKG